MDLRRKGRYRPIGLSAYRLPWRLSNIIKPSKTTLDENDENAILDILGYFES